MVSIWRHASTPTASVPHAELAASAARRSAENAAADARSRMHFVYYGPAVDTKKRRTFDAPRPTWYLDAMGELRVMILAAGLGTRLRPLTEHLPKPLVPIGDRPAVAHVIDHLRAAGAGVIVMNTHHLAEPLAAFAREAGVLVSEEPGELLGTAGGLRNAGAHLGAGPALVWNGDITGSLDARALWHAHLEGGAAATLMIVPRPRGEGNVGVDASGRLTRLRRETVAGGEIAGGDFTGVHVVGEEARATLPRVGCLVSDVYLPHLRRGGALAAIPTRAPFVDVGTLDAYLEANLAWLASRGLERFVGHGAEIRAEVTRSVVGRGARVLASIDRTVVWPGATVTEPCSGAVVGPFGVAPVRA